MSVVACLARLVFSLLVPPAPPTSPLFPYTTLFRSLPTGIGTVIAGVPSAVHGAFMRESPVDARPSDSRMNAPWTARSEEHTSELQSRRDLVCRLLLEKKKTTRCESAGATLRAARTA